MVTLIFYKGFESPYANFFDRLVCKWTKGPYSHIEILIDEYQYSSFQFEGVRKLKHNFDPQTWDYFKLKDIEKEKVKEFFELTKGQKYDWLGIFGFVFPIREEKNKWFCSEWVANALKISGCKKLWTYNPSKLSPNDIATILNLI